jgi:hypothetical protein
MEALNEISEGLEPAAASKLRKEVEELKEENRRLSRGQG